MLVLYRLASSSLGVQGVFVWNNHVVCHSLELPWRDNLANMSCIPARLYPITKEMHSRFGNVFRLSFVPNRTGILIHPGNSMFDSRGCILPGLDTDDNIGLKNSRSALQKLWSLLPTETDLFIKEFNNASF